MSSNFNKPTNPNNPNTIGRSIEHYGSLPSTPVAEQNQTYMAYFDGIGGTGPELIGQTAYFIKYLIDDQGNVNKPIFTDDPTSPGQAPYYNLYDNFTPGKYANVKLIEYDPTLANTSTGKALIGKHKITHVGEIFPILVTETGTKPSDFYQTLTFGPKTTNTTQSVTDLNAAWTRNPPISITPSNFLNWTTISYLYSGFLGNDFFPSQSQYWSNDTYSKILTSIDTDIANTRISATINAEIINKTKNSNYCIQFRLYKNLTAGGTVDSSSELLFESPLFSLNAFPNYPNPFVADSASFDNIYTWTTPYFDLEEDDKIGVRFKTFYPIGDELAISSYTAGDIYIRGVNNGVPDDNTSHTFLRINTEQPPANDDGEVLYIGGINSLISNFMDATTPAYASGSFSILSMGLQQQWIYYSNQIQTLGSFSEAMNFNQIAIPFKDFGVGDFIRINYEKDAVYTIIGKYPIYNGFQFMISPPLPNSLVLKLITFSSSINHFVMYRIAQNGRYVVLDVEKPKDGIYFSGIIQPEFVSKELNDNYEKIITDLTQKEIIN